MPTKKPEGTKTTAATHYGVASIAIGVCVFIWWVTGDPSKPPVRPKPDLYLGAVIDAPITLVSADKTDLACAFDKEVLGYRCAFTNKTDATAGLDTNNAEQRKKLLAPYMTVDNTMFLIPGLFEDPSVDERWRDEGMKRIPRDKQERFTAQCNVTLREEVDGVLVRWAPTKDWEGPHKVWVGEASDCRVSEP